LRCVHPHSSHAPRDGCAGQLSRARHYDRLILPRRSILVTQDRAFLYFDAKPWCRRQRYNPTSNDLLVLTEGQIICRKILLNRYNKKLNYFLDNVPQQKPDPTRDVAPRHHQPDRLSLAAEQWCRQEGSHRRPAQYAPCLDLGFANLIEKHATPADSATAWRV